jgi:hypothetical protein
MTHDAVMPEGFFSRRKVFRIELHGVLLRFITHHNMVLDTHEHTMFQPAGGADFAAA